MSKIRGTKEWSVASVNILSGCPHDCRYYYGRLGRWELSKPWI